MPPSLKNPLTLLDTPGAMVTASSLGARLYVTTVLSLQRLTSDVSLLSPTLVMEKAPYGGMSPPPENTLETIPRSSYSRETCPPPALMLRVLVYLRVGNLLILTLSMVLGATLSRPKRNNRVALVVTMFRTVAGEESVLLGPSSGPLVAGQTYPSGNVILAGEALTLERHVVIAALVVLNVV